MSARRIEWFNVRKKYRILRTGPFASLDNWPESLPLLVVSEISGIPFELIEADAISKKLATSEVALWKKEKQPPFTHEGCECWWHWLDDCIDEGGKTRPDGTTCQATFLSGDEQTNVSYSLETWTPVARANERHRYAVTLYDEASAADFSAWLHSIGETPGALVLAWLGDAWIEPHQNEEEGDATQGVRARQMAAIVATAKTLDYNPLAIPNGGKKAIMAECLKDTKTFMSDNSFEHGWRAARKAGKVQMANHAKMTRGQTRASA
ncbi:MAG: hypothetical protein Q8O37_09025 [Sulfuricellaceae bacterium]|nr:hypothetical protein [Sulfuricellaceae bacterium]